MMTGINLSITKLSEILMTVSDLPYGTVYLKGKYPWDVDTPSIILDDLNKDDELQLFREHGFRPVFDLGTVQAIVWYAMEKLPNAKMDQLIEAFNYYYKHDAFLDL